MTMMRKISFWVGIFFSIVLVVLGGFANRMPEGLKPYLEPIPLILLGILGWTIITLIDVWSINLDYQETIKSLGLRVNDMSAQVERSRDASQDSFKLLIPLLSGLKTIRA